MRVIIVGQSPSATSDPAVPLSGRSGAYLERLAGVEAGTLGRYFDRVNLFRERVERFDRTAAVARARELVEALDGRRVIFLGSAVAGAFAFDNPVLSWHMAVYAPGLPRRKGSVMARLTDGLGCKVEFAAAVLPHPSGLNLFYNLPENRAAASAFLRPIIDEEDRYGRA